MGLERDANDTCVTFSRNTHRYLKDRTTEKRQCTFKSDLKTIFACPGYAITTGQRRSQSNYKILNLVARVLPSLPNVGEARWRDKPIRSLRGPGYVGRPPGPLRPLSRELAITSRLLWRLWGSSFVCLWISAPKNSARTFFGTIHQTSINCAVMAPQV